MPSAELARILADLDAIRDTFRMDHDGLGPDLCKAATDGVKATIAAQQDPEGRTWKPLSDAYASWKNLHFPGKPKGHLYELMATDAEVEGVTVIHPAEAAVTYGKTPEARDEAEWFQEGSDDGHQPPRPFWDFTRDSLDSIARLLDDRFHSIPK